MARLRLKNAALASALWLLAGLCAHAGHAGQRLAPPEAVKCPRDHLTVYEGRVVSYSRTATRTSLRIRTDANTNESVAVRHPRGADPARWFLLWAEPFEPGDWRLIETRRGRLRAGMRANAWVCDDGSNPFIDWRPRRD